MSEWAMNETKIDAATKLKGKVDQEETLAIKTNAERKRNDTARE